MKTPFLARPGVAVAIAILLAPSATLAARPVGTPCPGTLQVNQAPVGVPDGWTVMVDPRRSAAHQLQAITFFAGNPNNMEALSPDSEKRSAKGYSSTWRFHSDQRGEDGYWIGCNYTDTNYLAIRKLADNISQCDLTQYLADRKRPGGAVEVVCY
jgi:hypothetical protein